MKMEVYTASEVKQAFGEVLLKAQKAPIAINKNGKPVAVLVSADDFALFQEARLMLELEKGMESARAGRTIGGQEAIRGFRQHITNA